MINQSKQQDPRFWKKWSNSGAVGTIEDAENTATYGSNIANRLRRYDCRTQSLEGIDKALEEGKILRAFMSGGGLRVVRIEDSQNGPLKGYGEHPNLMPAFRGASKDFLAGGKPYDGAYLTGTNQVSDNLDLWIRRGHKLWAELNGQGIKVEARDYNYKPIVTAVEEDFEKAYASLSELVTKETFEKVGRL